MNNAPRVVDTTLWVRYAETDQMGVVYHANYYIWFEVGRTAYFNSRNFTIVDMEREGVYFPVIEAFCRYRHPARYGDEIIVKTTVEEMRPTRVKMVYQILRAQDRKLLAEGHTMHAFMSKDGRPLNIRKTHPGLWESLNEGRF
jgi:acyl-CoA thioester hydrolase